MNKELKHFNETITACARDIYRVRRLKSRKKKGSGWWNEEIGTGPEEKERTLRSLKE